ncbi:hypothetical protein F5Y17DRAFT_323073 [Xylariaceae sp. FL0594]|nr:hypothetical protein F5Y17DRAFT_323073 [Xylariaceae sp. FL0594]
MRVLVLDCTRNKERSLTRHELLQKIFVTHRSKDLEVTVHSHPRWTNDGVIKTRPGESFNENSDTQQLRDEIRREGPFDGVVAFGKEAELVGRYLLLNEHHQSEDKEPASFQFAIFFDGALTLDYLMALGIDVPEAAKRVVKIAEDRAERKLGPLPEHVEGARRAMFNSDDCFGLNLNKSLPLLKINIPTLHVWSTSDPRFPRAIQLAGFCNSYLRKTLAHDGKGEVPKDSETVEKLRELVDWCVRSARWPGQDSFAAMAA